MFVVNNFMMAIAQLLDFLLTAYMWIIVGRAVISWVNACLLYTSDSADDLVSV